MKRTCCEVIFVIHYVVIKNLLKKTFCNILCIVHYFVIKLYEENILWGHLHTTFFWSYPLCTEHLVTSSVLLNFVNITYDDIIVIVQSFVIKLYEQNVLCIISIVHCFIIILYEFCKVTFIDILLVLTIT